MTDKTHPITPPPELAQKWLTEWQSNILPGTAPQYVATQAARWGADQELEACCAEIAWLESPSIAGKLLERRRPKPPSLKEQSLALIDKIQGNTEAWDIRDLNLVRRALETLND